MLRSEKIKINIYENIMIGDLYFCFYLGDRFHTQIKIFVPGNLM